MATAKRKPKTPSISELISESRRLWERYCTKPTKGNFQTFLKHQTKLEKFQMGRASISGRIDRELQNMEGPVGEGLVRHKIPHYRVGTK